VVAELLIRENGRFFETIHPFADFNITVPVWVEVGFGQIVFRKYFGRDVFAVEAHVLTNFHVRNEEKIFQIASAVASAIFCIGNDTVQM
jgi:hypothetical protein